MIKEYIVNWKQQYQTAYDCYSMMAEQYRQTLMRRDSNETFCNCQ